MKGIRNFCSICFLLIFSFASCTSGDNAKISSIPIHVDYVEFYKEFTALDTSNLQEGLDQLKTKYSDFLDFYIDTLSGLNIHGNYVEHLDDIRQFLVFKDFRQLFDTINIVFPETQKINKSLDNLFQHIKYQNNEFYIPEKIYYFASALNGFVAPIQNEKNMGVGLDMFLGKDFWAYRSIGIPDYALTKFSAEQIPVWVAKAIYEDKYPFKFTDLNLLEIMLAQGKEIYFLTNVLPSFPLHQIFGYTKEQLTWAEQNEALIYNTFIQNELLYNKEQQKIMRFVNDGPNTPGFDMESPGNIGTFIGYKIILSYAKRTKLSLVEVLNTSNAQEILKKANYKP